MFKIVTGIFSLYAIQHLKQEFSKIGSFLKILNALQEKKITISFNYLLYQNSSPANEIEIFAQ